MRQYASDNRILAKEMGDLIRQIKKVHDGNMTEISKTEETLKALKTRKKELAKVKEQADLQTLYAAIKESGKSVADVISSLK